MLKNNTQKMINLSLFISMALLLNYFERFIPLGIAVPGVKIGLANIVTLVVLEKYGWREAFLVLIIRTFMASLFFGGFAIFLYSVTGAIAALVVMALLWRFKDKGLSLIGISIAGASAHNFAQLLLAYFSLGSTAVFAYFAVFMLISIFAGFVIAVVTQNILKYF